MAINCHPFHVPKVMELCLKVDPCIFLGLKLCKVSQHGILSPKLPSICELYCREIQAILSLITWKFHICKNMHPETDVSYFVNLNGSCLCHIQLEF